MFRACVISLLLLSSSKATFAEILREKIQQRLARPLPGSEFLKADSSAPEFVPVPAGVRVEHNIAYGADANQKFDVYLPEKPDNAPVIFMVHGGAWQFGNKANRYVVENKVARWVPKGFIFISADYRMIPNADPVEQARDIARAVALAQSKAHSWGADSNQFILMGHSAGAHLVALLATGNSLSAGLAIKSWLGIVSLDSGAYDVVQIMEKPHFPLYDNAFGSDKNFWISASPFYALTKQTRPILAVCSSRRPDSTTQAHRFAEKAASLGVKVTVLEKDYSHMEINSLLGRDESYTSAVESFMSSLSPRLAGILKK